MTSSARIENTGPVSVEAGELKVPKGEILGPEKLKRLAKDGWSIYSSRPMRNGGYSLLLVKMEDRTRIPPKAKSKSAEEILYEYRTSNEGEFTGEIDPRVIHKGGPQCPNYCACVSERVIGSLGMPGW